MNIGENENMCKIKIKKYESFGYHVVNITKSICYIIIFCTIFFNGYCYIYNRFDQMCVKNIFVAIYGITGILALFGIKKVEKCCLIPLLWTLIHISINYAYQRILSIYYFEKSLDGIYQPLANSLGYLCLILQFLFIFFCILSVIRCYFYLKEVKDGRNYDRMLPSVDITLAQKTEKEANICNIIV